MKRDLQPLPDDRSQIFIGRQPILDRHERVVAYELLYRDSAESQTAVFSNQTVAAARTMANTFASMGPDAILGPYLGFVNVDRTTLLSGLVEALPRERVVIEVLEHIEADSQVVSACKRLCKAGYSIALDDYVDRDPRDELLEFAAYVKVDLMAVDHSKLPQLVRKLRRCDAKLLAEKVETREEFERCHKLGFDLFQGYYFARPTVITGRRIDPDRMELLSMLKQLSADVEIDVLCESIKHNANIGVSVLRLVNSAAMTSGTKIATVRDAVNYMGRRYLTR